jgi:hypothetical protein
MTRYPQRGRPMGFIEPTEFEWRQRKDGQRYKHALKGAKFKARYRDANGPAHSQTFDRQIDAERFVERNGADIQRGEWIDPAKRRTRFDNWADDWWRRRSGCGRTRGGGTGCCSRTTSSPTSVAARWHLSTSWTSSGSLPTSWATVTAPNKAAETGKPWATTTCRAMLWTVGTDDFAVTALALSIALAVVQYLYRRPRRRSRSLTS